MELYVRNKANAGAEPASFRKFVETHMRSVYRLAFELTRNHHDAEDLSQEVFIKAFDSLSDFRGEAAVETWLYRITVNTYLNSRRKKAVRLMQLRDDLAEFVGGSKHSDTSTKAEADNIRRHIDKAMKSLSPRERTAFALRCEHRLSLRETAAAMGIAEGTVKALQHRAVQKLREALSFISRGEE